MLVQDSTGLTGTTTQTFTVLGADGLPQAPDMTSVPQTDAGLSPVQVGPMDSQVNVAFVLVQAGREPQVSSSASISGPIELELLFANLDYSQPVNLTIRTVTGIVSKSYSFRLASEDISGNHATVIMDVPAVVGARYEIDLGSYHGTFYPLQQGGEKIPSYCRGAALDEVCIAGGICSDTGSQGLICPGSGPCATPTTDPAGCLTSQPIIGSTIETVECYALDTVDCAGLNGVVDEVNRQVADLLAIIQECVALQPTAQAAATTLPCQDVYALVQSISPVLLGVIHDALEGCGLDAPTESPSAATDETCKALIDYALTVPGTVLATLNELVAECGVHPTALESQASVADCQGVIAQVLALPGVVLGIAEGVIESCGLNNPTASTSTMSTDCQSVLATVLDLSRQILPMVEDLIGQCTGDFAMSTASATDCRGLIATVLAVPGQVMPIVQGLIGQCTSSMATSASVDCDAILDELGGLPATVAGIVGGLVPQCTTAQANINPCGGNLQDYLDRVCGSDGCSVPHLKIGFQPRDMSASSSSSDDGCSDSYHFETKLADLSERKIHPWDPNEFSVEDYELSKTFYELTYGDPCSTPTPDMLGYFGMGFGWRGPTRVAQDEHWLVEWETTATGSSIPYNLAPFAHYVAARPFVHFVKPTGSANVEVEDAWTIGFAASRCADGPWPPDVAALVLDLAKKLPQKVSVALSLASIVNDLYCSSNQSKNWLKKGCEDEDAAIPYCKGVEIRRWNQGVEPRFNYGEAKPEDTYGGYIQLHAVSEGTYTMDLWNRMRVIGTVQGPDAAYETPFGGWIEQGAEVTAAVGAPGAN
jgi:hypothetical protein